LPQLSLSDDSRRLAVADNDYDNPILKIFDTDTRVEQASRRLPPLTSFGSMYQPLEFDEERNRLFVGYHERRGVLGSELSGRLLVLDAGTLGDLGAVDGGAPKFALARRNELGVNAPFFSGRGGCVTIAVEVWGADNSPLRVSSGIRCLSGSTIVSVPDAMSTVAHHVTDRRVTLSWPTVLGASDYVVEAGSLPGLSNLARVQSGGANQFVANGVPPGTYYVRVRGLNEVGSGTPSPELIVTVR
jgi:hypothetical protein